VSNGAEVGLTDGDNDRGSELHVERPEPAHAGYTQAAVSPTKGDDPKLIPAQFSIITTLRLLQKENAK